MCTFHMCLYLGLIAHVSHTTHLNPNQTIDPNYLPSNGVQIQVGTTISTINFKETRKLPRRRTSPGHDWAIPGVRRVSGPRPRNCKSAIVDFVPPVHLMVSVAPAGKAREVNAGRQTRRTDESQRPGNDVKLEGEGVCSVEIGIYYVLLLYFYQFGKMYV